MSRTTKKRPDSRRDGEPGGFLSGLSNLIESLAELAEKGKEIQGVREFGGDELKGVYGFTIRTNLAAGDQGHGVKVEPFGNMRADERTGRVRVHEVIEPQTDLFDEPEQVAVVAELPGVGPEDIAIELQEDILIIKAQHGEKKYQKEVLLPEAFKPEQMTHSCHNGVLEVRFRR